MNRNSVIENTNLVIKLLMTFHSFLLLIVFTPLWPIVDFTLLVSCYIIWSIKMKTIANPISVLRAFCEMIYVIGINEIISFNKRAGLQWERNTKDLMTWAIEPYRILFILSARINLYLVSLFIDPSINKNTSIDDIFHKYGIETSE